MKTIKKIERKPGALYFINELGEVFESETHIGMVDKIDKIEGRVYGIMADGSIIEKELITLDLETFYEYKKNGRLSELFREGKEVEVSTKDVFLSVLEAFEDDFTASLLEGKKIEKIEINKNNGVRSFSLFLDSGKKLVLKEGLLVGGSMIEIK